MLSNSFSWYGELKSTLVQAEETACGPRRLRSTSSLLCLVPPRRLLEAFVLSVDSSRTYLGRSGTFGMQCCSCSCTAHSSWRVGYKTASIKRIAVAESRTPTVLPSSPSYSERLCNLALHDRHRLTSILSGAPDPARATLELKTG